jgi:cytochrome c553
VGEMRLEVMDAKKRFEQRIDEFKKQLEDYRKNNDIIDELKKAHQKELAAYVQEQNKKYNELLKDKLNSEDALRAQAEAEKA